MRRSLAFLASASLLAGCGPSDGGSHDEVDDGVDDVVAIAVYPADIVIDSETSLSFHAAGISELGFLRPVENLVWSFYEPDRGNEFAGGGLATLTPDGVFTSNGTPSVSASHYVLASSNGVSGTAHVRVIPPGTLSLRAVPPGGQTGDPYTASVELLSPGTIFSSDANDFGSVVVTGDFSGPLDLRISLETVNGPFSTDLFGFLPKECSIAL